jgi:hypothetical protein
MREEQDGKEDWVEESHRVALEIAQRRPEQCMSGCEIERRIDGWCR